MNKTLVARGLCKHYGEIEAVAGIDLSIAKGEIFGFLGPNGAGKTTTIRMLCGILKPSGGKATILGLDLLTQRESIKEKIGYVSQYFSLYRDLTVEENIRFFANLYGVVDLTGAGALIEQYNLGRYRRTQAAALSGGYRQRLALVCALVHRPELIFLDEPTAGLDPVTRKDLWDLFYHLSDRGMTLFVTTHYMEEAERCHSLAFIYQGRIAATGTPMVIRNTLSDRECFEITSSYNENIITRLKKLKGIETVNQFGSSLRVIVRKGAHTPSSLSRALGRPGKIRPTTPNIEDVFVNLTARKR